MEIWYHKDEKGIEKYKYLIMLDLNLEELKELSKKDRLVKEYRMNVEIVNKDPRFRVYMTEEEDRRKCYNTDIRIAREIGLKEGLEEGIEQGAKELLSLDVEMDKILKATKLDIEEIEALKNEKQKI